MRMLRRILIMIFSTALLFSLGQTFDDNRASAFYCGTGGLNQGGVQGDIRIAIPPPSGIVFAYIARSLEHIHTSFMERRSMDIRFQKHIATAARTVGLSFNTS